MPDVKLRRRPLGTACAVGGTLLLAWLGLVGFQLMSAYSDIRDGLSAMKAARDGAGIAAVTEGLLLPDLRNVGSQFASADDRLGSALLAPARILPFAGRQIRSVRAQASVASEVARVTEAGLTAAQPVLRDPGGTTAAKVQSIRRLGEIAARADHDLAPLGLGARNGLVAPIARAHNRLARELAELRASVEKAATGSAAIADLLAGPRRYLLLAANNAEMRAGSGMFLAAGELESGSDKLHLRDVRTITDVPVPPDAVPITGDLADRWGWLEPNVEWRNLMTSPRFDVAAPVAAQMWTAAGNRAVDGVMVVDPFVLRSVLAATGPILVDGRRIDQNNIEQELLHDQYLRFPEFEERPERREGLGRLAREVFEALDAGTWSVPRLATGIARAAGGRHLLLWSAAPAEQAAWAKLGVDGSLQPDSLAVSVLNRGGNKLDWFLRMSNRVSLRAIGDETEVTLEVSIENTVPEGQPRYVAGPDPNSGVAEGVYLGILTVQVPGAALSGHFEGVESLAVNGRDGPGQVMGFEFTLPRGMARTVVARFWLPKGETALRIVPSTRIPAVQWTNGIETWADTSTRVLTWTN